MTPRTGRPPSEESKNHGYRLRMSYADIEKLDYCCEVLELSKAEVIRQGIEILYRKAVKLKGEPPMISTPKRKHAIGHAPGDLRDKLLDTLSYQNEWYENFETEEEAIDCLNSLWHCSDIMPSGEREVAAAWLYQNSDIDREQADRLMTYAQFVRRMKPAYTKMLNQK